ncbi:MAG: peptidylprolyl isomerase [bacterium]
MIMEKFRKHMAVFFWIVAIAFVGGFGLSSLWDSIGRGGGGSSTPEIPQDTSFTVGSNAISAVLYSLTVNRELTQTQQRGIYVGPQQRDLIAERVFLTLVFNEQIYQKADRIGFKVSDNYLNMLVDTLVYYDRFYAQLYRLSPEIFEQYLRKREVAKGMKTFMGFSAWLSPIQVVNQMKLQSSNFSAEYLYYPGEADTSEYDILSRANQIFDTLQAQSLTSLPEQVVVKYVSLPYGPQEEDWLRVQRKANNIRNNLLNVDPDSISAKFSLLAEQISEDYGSRSQGGYLGWISENTNVDENFKSAALSLSPGDLSSPVRTEYGWHLLLAGSAQQDSVEIFHILLKVSGDPERDQKSLDLMETVVTESRSSGLISVAEKYSLDLQTSSPFDRWGRFPPEFGYQQNIVDYAFAVDSGAVNGPFFGDNNILVLQVESHYPSRPMNFEDMKQQLVDSVYTELAMADGVNKAARGVELLIQGMTLADIAMQTEAEYVEPVEFSFYDDLPFSPPAGMVQGLAFTASDTGYYGPISGNQGAYLIHLTGQYHQPDSVIQHDLPYFWMNMSFGRGMEFINQWTITILEKAFSTGQITDFRFRED